MGEDGATFFDYRKGDIVFDAEQTNRLLQNGKLEGARNRGQSFAYGTPEGLAFAQTTGNGGFLSIKVPTSTSTNIYTQGADSSSSSSSSSDPERFDFVEIAIQRITEAIDRLKRAADSVYKTLKNRLSATTQEINKVTEEIDLQSKAYNRYMQEANSIALSADMKKKIQDGALDISLLDDDTRKQVDLYEEYYEKAIACKDAIDELKESLSDLYKQRFDNIQEDYNNQLEVYESRIETLANSSYVSVGKNNTGLTDTTKLLQSEISIMGKQLTDMNSAFEEAVSSGGIEKYSEAWYEMSHAIDDVRQNIIDAYNDISQAYVDTFNNLETFYNNQKGLYDDEIESFANSSYVTAATNNENNSKQLTGYYKELNLLEKELTDLTKARDRAVDSGAIIKGSEAWFEMQSSINDVAQSISDTHESIAAVFENTFDNLENHYGHFLDELSHLTNQYNKEIETATAKGYILSTNYYADLSTVESKNIQTLNKELKSLEKAMSNAMNSGEIAEYSDAWFDMKSSIDDVKDSIADANLQLIEYANTMRELEWSYFDLIQSKISELTDESDFLIELLSNRDLYEDNGQFNDNGMATMGLRAQNYDVAMAQADKYAEEVLKLDKEIAKDPYNTTLIDRRKELIDLQRESILAAESEKEAIKSLVSDGINKELESLRSLVDTYKENLSSAHDLYEYQKNIEEQTQNIANLRKQLASYSGDNSEENRARTQKIEVDLAKAEEELAETEYEQFITDATKLLDSLYDEYEEILNQRLDNIDLLLSDMITAVNENSTLIWETLSNTASEVGYSLMEGTATIWNNADTSLQAINGTVAIYGDGIIGSLTDVGLAIAQIDADVKSQIAYSDAMANASSTAILGAADILNKDASVINSSIAAVNTTVASAGTNVTSAINSLLNNMSSNATTINGTLVSIQDLVNKSLNASAQTKTTSTTAKKASTTTTTQKAATTTATTAARTSSISTNLSNLANKVQSSYSSVPRFDSGSSMMDYLRSKSSNASSYSSNVTMNFNIENVQDYNDFMTQWSNDTQARKLIQDVTIGKLATRGSNLKVYNYKWS